MLVPDPNPMLSEKAIADRVETLGAEIVESCGGAPLTLLSLLRGSYVFTADIARAISRAGGRVEEIDFLVVSSYGSGTVSSGNVKIERDVRRDIAGRHVLIVDDILDTGNTLQKIRSLMASRRPAWLASAVLLDKPARREVNVEAEFIGFTIEDEFVIGYGLDHDQAYRELPYITIMREQQLG